MKLNFLFILVFLLIFFLHTGQVRAQALNDSLLQKASIYKSKQPGQVLYVITDKKVYTPGETIWMAGYLLNRWQVADSLQADMLSIGVKKEGADYYALKKTYLIEKNICAASLYLPDTLRPGNYELIAATNIIDKGSTSQQIYHTKIQVGITNKPDFVTQYKVHNTNRDSIYVDVQIIAGNQSTYIPNAAMEYGFKNQKKQKQKLNTDGAGKIALSRTDVAKAGSLLQITSTVENRDVHNEILLPNLQDSLQVSFYPEGGNLVQGITSRIGWETKMFNSAIPTKAILYSNDKAIDTISTNDTGMGVFELQPQKGNNYYIRIINTENNTLQLTKYNLPVILEKGAILHLPPATSDSLLPVHITTTNSGMYSLALRRLVNNETIVIPAFKVDAEKYFSIDMSEALRGLVQVTLLDEQGRPVAERLAFVRYKHQPAINIITNKNNYDLGDSVALNVSVNSSGSQLQDALFTVSCVHLGRTNRNNDNNIASFYYLNYWLDGAENNSCNSAAAIDTVLLIKGWRRYTWQNFTDVDTANIISFTKTKLQGQVIAASGKVKKAMNVLISNKNGLWNTLATDNSGGFTLHPETITVPEGKVFFMKLTGNASGYKAIVKSPDDYLFNRLTNTNQNTLGYIPNTWTKVQADITDDGFNTTKQLETVVVKAKSFKQFKTGPPGANECGDYVCDNGYLNCPNHSKYSNGSKMPVKGENYLLHPISTLSGTIKTVYSGCKLAGINQGGIYTSREFYGMDSSILSNPDEKVFMSTIYWNPFVIHNKTQAAPIKFYTSDQPGKYLITVQGVTEAGEVFYADKMIHVRSD